MYKKFSHENLLSINCTIGLPVTLFIPMKNILIWSVLIFNGWFGMMSNVCIVPNDKNKNWTEYVLHRLCVNLWFLEKSFSVRFLMLSSGFWWEISIIEGKIQPKK